MGSKRTILADGPIGIFDSGVGGLSVLVEINRLLPAEDIVYMADTANCPYGNKSLEEIQQLAIKATEFLVSQGAKAIVVACNTASVAALNTLRSVFPLPFVGMVPAVKSASVATRCGKVGIIATDATFQAELFAHLVSEFASGIEVLEQSCPGLVELVEAGETDSPNTDRLLHQYLQPLLGEGIDTLVLGCTHYPFLRPAIERLVGPKITIIDTGLPVAKQVRRVLAANGLTTGRQGDGKVSLYTTGDVELFTNVVKRILKSKSTWEMRHR
ncbi:MAG: glutamate racemase [Dehalococcoidia bacterium]|nr:glutamate racemase [Dehalococcoidia bacterium]